MLTLDTRGYSKRPWMTMLCARNLLWSGKHPYDGRCFFGYGRNFVHPVARMNRFCNSTIRTAKVSSDALENLLGDFTHASLALHGRGPCLPPPVTTWVSIQLAVGSTVEDRLLFCRSFLPSDRSKRGCNERIDRRLVVVASAPTTGRQE